LRAECMLAGGNDLVEKPFHLAGLTLKAMLWLLRGNLANSLGPHSNDNGHSPCAPSDSLRDSRPA
jgi:hypothetical protein